MEKFFFFRDNRKIFLFLQIMLRQPRGKPESSESVCQPVENLKIDAVSEVADTKRKSPHDVWIDKPARCALLFLDHRIPVVRLKIVPKKPSEASPGNFQIPGVRSKALWRS